jgi:hypothetical protein
MFMVSRINFCNCDCEHSEAISWPSMGLLRRFTPRKDRRVISL